MPSKKASSEFSCVVCTQRKVRCDKEKPCKNCIKAGISCEVAPPPPPRRRKRKPGERELLRKVAKYEELMDRNGVDFRSAGDDLEPLKYDRDATSTPASTDHGSHSIDGKDEEGPRQCHKEFENASNILFGNSTEAETARATFHQAFDAVFDCANSFPFAVGPSSRLDLIDIHPTAMQMLQLWQTYLSNVDPLLKLTHTPTLQKRVFEASGKLSSRLSIDPDLEALLFNIYFISINSLTQTEVLASFGETKSTLQARYQVASQQTLLNASLMKTLDLAVLQAYVLHLTSIRTFVDPRTHYVMIGIAVRIAIRLGIHRDGQHSRLSSFDNEQRRRLWWNLVALDKRIAETTGSAVTAMSTPRADCKRPLNLNDSDLYIHARQEPLASNVSTEMVFCLARYELAATAAPDGMNTIPTLATTNASSNSSRGRPSESEPTSHPPKLRVGIDDYAKFVEATYLSSLDPSVPLHLFTIMITQQSLRKVQLVANVSSVLREPLASPELRQWAFEESLRLLEDDNTMQSTPSLQGWLWYTHMHFPFPAYMFLVHELKRTCSGEMCSRAWEAMDRNHRLRNLVGPGKKGSPMHLAYGKHFLEAWDARVQAEGEQGRILQTPDVVALVQQIHRPEQSSGPEQQFSNPITGMNMPSGLQIWHGPFQSTDIDDLDPWSSFEDISGMEYLIPSLI